VCLPTTIKWQHRGAPIHSDGRAEEFKKSSFTRLRAEESSDFIEAYCGVSSRERPYEVVIHLYVCVFDL